MQPLTRNQSLIAGACAIGAVFLLQAFNSAACYRHDMATFLSVLAMFVVPPMLPALVGLATKQPLRAVGGSLLFAPWLMLAYTTDCVMPYAGGGASMIYVAVVLWGFPCCLVGVLLSVRVGRALGFIERKA